MFSSGIQFTFDVVPNCVGVSSGVAVGNGGLDVPARAEKDLNLIMSGEETLSLAR